MTNLPEPPEGYGPWIPYCPFDPGVTEPPENAQGCEVAVILAAGNVAGPAIDYEWQIDETAGDITHYALPKGQPAFARYEGPLPGKSADPREGYGPWIAATWEDTPAWLDESETIDPLARYEVKDSTYELYDQKVEQTTGEWDAYVAVRLREDHPIYAYSEGSLTAPQIIAQIARAKRAEMERTPLFGEWS